jgi:hypothetical protein
MKNIFRIISVILLILVVLGGMALFNPRGARANVIEVDFAGDGFAVDGFCSLREAIDNANQDSMVHGDCIAGSGADVISLPGWLFTLQQVGAGENLNQTGDLDITGDLTIIGQNPATTIIQAGTSSPLGSCGDCRDRVFHILPGADVTFSKVTIRYGHAPDGAIGASAEHGGGIKNEGDLFLSNTIVTYNMAGDGYDSDTYAGGFAGNGGGIQNLGTLTAINSRITHNRAGHGGNGWEGGPGQFGGYGGGIYAGLEHSISLTASIVGDNSAGNGGYGGDVIMGAAGWGGDGGKGGGIYCGNCTLTMLYSSLLTNNSGYGGDGGYWVGFDEDLPGDGGDGGYGGDGGGLHLNGVDATATIAASRIHNNHAGYGGYGGTGSMYGYNGFDGLQGDGGGLYSYSNSQMSISSSTVSDNNARNGGGINNNSDATATLYNSTISGNYAVAHGGGIYGEDPSTMEMTFSTVTDNTVPLYGDGGGFWYYGTFTITNNIIAGNHSNVNYNEDCRGFPTSLGYNIIGIDWSGCIEAIPWLLTDQVGTKGVPIDPVLNALADNGGPTQTHELDLTSPAVDQIPNGVSGCIVNVTKDQRYVKRYDDCDIGAFEIDQFSHVFLPLIMR